MKFLANPTTTVSDFRVQSTLGLCIISIIFLAPFAINLFFQRSWILAIGLLIIVMLFAINAWQCARGKFDSRLTFYILIPIVIAVLSYSFKVVGMLGIFWCFPAVLAFFFMLNERQAWIANTAFLIIIFPQVWQILEAPLAIRFFVGLTLVYAFSGVFVRVISRQQQELGKLAITDPLTGLLNRTLLHETLHHAIQLHQRLNAPMTLISFDLDHFKSINDTHGHDAGDRILSGIGEYLQQYIRHSDKVFRPGGEEFLAVLYDTDETQAVHVAEELRRGIAALESHPVARITASFGVTTLQPGEDWETWMKRCDNRLYRAKKQGRNRVVA